MCGARVPQAAGVRGSVRRRLIDELASDAGHPALLVAADYDPGLHYLCLTAFDTGPGPRHPEPAGRPGRSAKGPAG